MTTRKYTDIKYVVLAGVAVLTTIMCSAIVDMDFIDVIYLTFLFVCLIRYIMVCRKN